MSNPKINQIRSNSRARFKVIDRTSKTLKTRFVGLERELYKKVLERLINRLQFENGIIVDSPFNRDLIVNAGFIQTFFSNTAAPEVIKILNGSFKSLDLAAFEKASLFANVKDIKAQIQNRSKQALGFKPRGLAAGAFYTNMIGDTTQSGKVFQALNTALISGQNKEGVKQIIRESIIGTDDKLGVISNFQELTMQSTTATESYDRYIQNAYAREIDLNYAIYQGGEIKSTRDFCEERNGKVYKREEILSWQGLEWQGKKDPHNIITDCGGYNCRHYYDWISYELAVQLRSNIGRSIFDG